MSKTNPLISVIVTTYNRKDLLKETINSILCQTYKNFELIIIDNYSEYDFLSFVKSLNDSRLRPYQYKNNGIIAINRNYGIKKSIGEYIAFCDDDDLWKKNKLDKQLKCFLMNEEIGICFTTYSIINNKGEIISKQKLKRKYSNPTFANFFLSAGYICNSSVMINANFLNKIGYQDESPEMISIEDSEYWATILSIYKGCFIKDNLVDYRIHIDNVQKKAGNTFLNEQKLFYKAISKKIKIPFYLRSLKIFKIYIQYFFSHLIYK